MLRRLVLQLNTFTKNAFNDPVRRFQLSMLALILLTAFATAVYMTLEKMSFFDALYMTVITITTVGFGEVQSLSTTGRAFTIVLIVLGVGAATSAISNAVGIVVGPLLWASIRKRNMERKLNSMKDHYIVCGYGRMGSQVIADLRKRGKEFVLVDSSFDKEEFFIEQGFPYIIGDATLDENLLGAGIERARGLVAALNTDPGNVMTVLTARELNPRLYIVARVSHIEAESKLRRAGANRVVSPYQIGGHRIALALIRPQVDRFLDRIFHFERSADTDVDIGQLTVLEGSNLAGQTIATCGLRSDYNVSVLAIQRSNGEIIITPNPAQTLDVGVTVIIIGPPDNVYALEREHERERS